MLNLGLFWMLWRWVCTRLTQRVVARKGQTEHSSTSQHTKDGTARFSDSVQRRLQSQTTNKHEFINRKQDESLKAKVLARLIQVHTATVGIALHQAREVVRTKVSCPTGCGPVEPLLWWASAQLYRAWRRGCPVSVHICDVGILVMRACACYLIPGGTSTVCTGKQLQHASDVCHLKHAPDGHSPVRSGDEAQKGHLDTHKALFHT